MVLSTIGYAFQGNTGSTPTTGELDYNGYKFLPQSGFWVLQLGDFVFRFAYTPHQVKDIQGELKPLSEYSGKPLYISSDSSLAEGEIYANMDQIILRRQYACTEGEECPEDFPVKNCDENFIVIREENFTNVLQENNCVFILAPQDELVQATDAFLYKIIGVK